MFGRVCAPSCTCVCVCLCLCIHAAQPKTQYGKVSAAEVVGWAAAALYCQRFSILDSGFFYGALRKKKPLLIPHTNTDLYEDTRAYKDTHVLVEWRDEESEEEEEVWLILSSCVWKEWWRWANAVKSFWLRRIKTHKYTHTHRHRYDLSI